MHLKLKYYWGWSKCCICTRNFTKNSKRKLHKKYTVRVFEQHGLFGCGKTHSKYKRKCIIK